MLAALFPMLVPILFVFVLGAAVGSFLNVVVYRLPAGLSLLYPPSRCPKCKTRLRPRDNVPVLGWLWLRGRCRYCRQPIPMRYPAVELVTGLLFLGIFYQFGWTGTTWGYWLFGSLLLALALIDFDTLTLPSSLLTVGVVSGWIWQATMGYAASPESGLVRWIASLGATVLGLWLLSLIRFLGTVVLKKEAMGGADSKLAAMIGSWLFWPGLLVSLFLAALLGTMLGLGGQWLNRRNRFQPMPFGPFLAMGALVSLLWGEGLVHRYLSWFGLSG